MLYSGNMLEREIPKVLPVNHPRKLSTLLGWLVGIGSTVLFVYWWFDSLFPGRELSGEALLAKLLAVGATVLVSLYLMHINYD